ncbi:MAG: type II toxin-antitoxin system Phd/YefM family antitoxin [Actinomycetota bacterium]
MQEIAISKFKATCLAKLEWVRKTGQPLLVTKRGVPVAQITPPPSSATNLTSFGSMAGTAKERGDIVEPLSDQDSGFSEWDEWKKFG